MPLTAIALNCTLKSGKEQPSTDKLLGEVLDELMKHDVSGEIVRVADHTIKPGVTSDEGDGDEWPALRQKIIAADIFVLGTPTWMGQPSSICKRVLERLDSPRTAILHTLHPGRRWWFRWSAFLPPAWRRAR